MRFELMGTLYADFQLRAGGKDDMNIRAELEEKGNKAAEEIAEVVRKSPNNLQNLVDEMFS